MEVLLRILAYSMQLGPILLLAAVVPILLYRKRKKLKLSLIVFVLVLAAELAGILYLSEHPVWICPKEYAPYISEEDKRSLIGVNSGIYSKNIPIFPVCIVVTEADDAHIEVHTYYLMFGKTGTGLSEDGFDSLFGLSGWQYRRPG